MINELLLFFLSSKTSSSPADGTACSGSLSKREECGWMMLLRPVGFPAGLMAAGDAIWLLLRGSFISIVT